MRNNVRAFRERRLEKRLSSGDQEVESDGRLRNKSSPSEVLPPSDLSPQSSFLITSHDIDDKLFSERDAESEPLPTQSYNHPYYPEQEEEPRASNHTQQRTHANEINDPTALTRYTPSPVSTDIVQYSDSSPLDLSFGYFEAIVREGDAWVGGYPFWDSLQKLRNDDLVNICVLSATTAGFGILGQDRGLARQSRESYQIGLQKLRTRLSLVGSVQADQAGLGLMHANYSLVSVEFCENLWAGWEGPVAPWILLLKAGFAMMESAGPVGFRDATGVACLRSMRSRIVSYVSRELFIRKTNRSAALCSHS